MKFSLRQLEYLVALAERLSFHDAARACHVSQPGLSTQINQLESALDVRLFERDRRHVMLTAAGVELVRRARHILAGAEELAGAARAFSGPLSGPLSLGVIPTIAPYVLPAVLPVVREQYPDLGLRLREDRTPQLVKQLHGGALDLLLLALESDLEGAISCKVFKDDFVLAAPAGHRLAGRGKVRESDLAGESVLLLDDGHCLRDQALSVCALAGASEVGDVRATSLSTLAQMVAGGLGVTLLPSVAVAVEAAAARRLVIRKFFRPAPYRTIGLAWRSTSPHGQVFRQLAKLMGDSLRQLKFGAAGSQWENA